MGEMVDEYCRTGARVEGICEFFQAAHCCSNPHGHFLILAEFGGCDRKGHILIPESIRGKGWKGLALALRKVAYVFQILLVLDRKQS